MRLYILFLSAFLLNQLQGQDKTKIKPIFEDGLSQIVPEFQNADTWIRHDLFVPTDFDSDGDGDFDMVHVSVTRPAQTETEGLKLPIIYNTSPYFAGVAGNTPGLFWDVRHELGEIGQERMHPEVEMRSNRPYISNAHLSTWVPRGYIVVHSSSPGTGLSDGSPTVGGDNESLAPKAVIEWLCGNRKGYTEKDGGEEVEAFWSTGKVGMTGASYNGTLPLAAATTGVEGLEVIIPIAPNTSYYHYYRSNGLVRSPGGYLGEDIDVLYDFIHSGDPSKRAWANLNIRDTEMKDGMDRETGDYNDFWAGRDYVNDMDGMKCAMLMVHGFNDWNVMPEHSYRIYEKAKDMGLPTKIYYHQSGHGGRPPVALMNKWFSHYLHGLDNNVLEGGDAYIVRENGEFDDYITYADYPNPDAELVPLYLKGGSPGQGELKLEPTKAVQNETIVDNFSFDGSTLAKAEYTDHRLMYVTPELKDDLHLSGLAEVTITLASSKPTANLSIWLVALPWEEGRGVKITDNIITRGWADPQNSKSISESEPLVPGEFVTLTFEMQPDDQIIPAGQQIGLMIFSSDREFTLWPDPGTELTVDLEKTILKLPVVGGRSALEGAFSKN